MIEKNEINVVTLQQHYIKTEMIPLAITIKTDQELLLWQ